MRLGHETEHNGPGLCPHRYILNLSKASLHLLFASLSQPGARDIEVPEYTRLGDKAIVLEYSPAT